MQNMGLFKVFCGNAIHRHRDKHERRKKNVANLGFLFLVWEKCWVFEREKIYLGLLIMTKKWFLKSTKIFLQRG